MPEQPFDIRILAERFKELRQEHKLTQKQMAEVLGVTERTIIRIENCKSGLGDKTMLAVIKQFGMETFEYLIDYENQIKNKISSSDNPQRR